MQQQFVYHVPEYQLQPYEPHDKDRGYVILSNKTRMAYPVSEIAALIWTCCGRVHQLSELVQVLCERFSKIPSVKQDVLEILGQFHDAGIIKFSDRDLSSDCAIIITVHNHIEKFGIPCLESVLEHSGNAQVYLYDNESTDPKIRYLKKLAENRPEVEYIRIDDQNAFGGLTGTWNDGIRRARKQGLGKVILLNHDVIVDNTWGYFIQAIESDFCIYGPLTNRPGGGPRDKELQMADRAEFQGLRNTRILMGFCMGFTLGRPELKLFDDWRFFNPELPFGGNEFGIQKRMKKQSAKTAFYIVTDSWVFHHLNMGWKDNPRYQDPHDPAKQFGSETAKTRSPEPSRSNYITRLADDNIAHYVRLEFLKLERFDPVALGKGKLHIVENEIDRKNPSQIWREYVLSCVFDQVEYIKEEAVDRIKHPVPLSTKNGHNRRDFIEYSPNAQYLRLSEFIKENAEIKAPEQYYVLLNQRPDGNRFMLESKTGLPLEEFLRPALEKLGIPFINCDFSTIKPSQQAQLCRGARVFVAAHGAGFANIIFTPQHCHILEVNFRKHWNCHPVCDGHLSGELADHEKCNSGLAKYPIFHKADFHNMSYLLGRAYKEFEVVRYEGHIDKNPISRNYLIVDGEKLLAEIEMRMSLHKSSFNVGPRFQNIEWWTTGENVGEGYRYTRIHHIWNRFTVTSNRVRTALREAERSVRWAIRGRR